jgi:hypothetical protein
VPLNLRDWRQYCDHRGGPIDWVHTPSPATAWVSTIDRCEHPMITARSVYKREDPSTHRIFIRPSFFTQSPPCTRHLLSLRSRSSEPPLLSRLARRRYVQAQEIHPMLYRAHIHHSFTICSGRSNKTCPNFSTELLTDM